MKNIKELGLELIELKDQVLLVTQNEMISPDDLVFESKDRLYSVTESTYTNPKEYGVYKILASTVKLRKGFPLLVIEDEVDQIADELISSSSNLDVKFVKEVWKNGYNKAKETYKFTEEDLRGIFLMGLMENISSILKERSLEKEEIIVLFQKYMQSLTKKELWVEVELDQINVNHKTGHEVNKVIPKISQGKIKAIWK